VRVPLDPQGISGNIGAEQEFTKEDSWMHATLVAIRTKLSEIAAQIKGIGNEEPLGIAHNHWGLPGITRTELMEEAQSIITLIDERGSDDMGDSDARIKDYIRRLEHLRSHTIGQFWGPNGGQAVSAYMLTLEGLRKVLAPALTPSKDESAEAIRTIRKLTNQLRGMEARFRGLEPRTSTVETMVERIEKAYTAADQLPADLESLAEAQKEIGELGRIANKDQIHLSAIRERAEELDKKLQASAEVAQSVVEQCQRAYSAATSVGLAAAFSERSVALNRSMWIWVYGLIGALAAGSYLGYDRLRALSELLKTPNEATSVIILNLLLSILSVAAPVWFAWLATKQIGQRFRLSEDYGFKASISRAYEGFRREAARFDKDMESRLLVSALNRMDELPGRLVESESHGSPWHELASSNVVKQALNSVPGFAAEVKDLASKAISALTPGKGNAAGSAEGKT
jgi:hypothetical protein